MTRYERRMFFDRLCELRDQATRAGRADREPVLNVAEAVEWASALMAALEMEDAITAKAARS